MVLNTLRPIVLQFSKTQVLRPNLSLWICSCRTIFLIWPVTWGFADEDIIWLYSYFTDLKIAPTTYTVKDLEKEIPYDITRREINGKVVKLFCAKEDIFYAAYLRKEGEDIVHRVEKVSRGCLIRKDFLLLH